MTDTPAIAPASPHLNGHHRKTMAALFQHPTAHNVEWHDVLSLLGVIGSVAERHGGGYELAIGAERLNLGRAHDHDISGDELRHLRAFLVKAGVAPGETAPASSANPVERQCIVLIDHHQARLFDPGASAHDAHTARVLKPDDPDGTRARIEHRQGINEANGGPLGAHDGGHSPEDDGYYERVAVDLAPAQRIVVLSDGKGRSNAGAYLVEYLRRHHPATAQRIVATDRVDIAHLSDRQVVAAGLVLLGDA
ncbi:hypothetical protein [Novosphingobium sp.]|uniref:hypothetical protein n=1 Tax=Novosphingobium sp. TaxID=1874826 RepID=UPI0033423D72